MKEWTAPESKAGANTRAWTNKSVSVKAHPWAAKTAE